MPARDISALLAASGTGSAAHSEMDLADSDVIVGLHGTIAEQCDEDHLDDRSDADDDLNKGKIRFPKAKLYGRETELHQLLRVYEDVTVQSDGFHKEAAAPSSSGAVPSTGGSNRDLSQAEGDAPQTNVAKNNSSTRTRVIFLGGLSGTGKSALIAELISRVNKSESAHPHRLPLFGSGKFEQFENAAPFTALSDGLAMWTAQLLERAERKNDDGEEMRLLTKAIKKAGLTVTEEDGEILVNMFPALAPLLGAGDKEEGIGSDAAGPKPPRKASLRHMSLDITRLKIVVQNLIKALGRKQERPLVLFVDDLQWADETSLEIITSIVLNRTIQNFLFVGAYRSNEIEEDSPGSKRMADIEAGMVPGSVTKMEISGLKPKDIAKFCADCTDREVEDVDPLVDLVYKKTLGNIFFVQQALEELVRRNILYYDMICYEWQWNLDLSAEIEDFVSSDVVDMVKRKIGGLSEDCQRGLVLMAYSQKILKAVTLQALLDADGRDLDVFRTIKLMGEAASEGLLLPTDKDAEYTFAHDLIEQAAHSLVPEGSDRDDVFVLVANVLVERERVDNEDWMLFVAARHFNAVPRDRIESLDDLAALNLKTAKTAAAKASLSQAVELLRAAVSCLDEETCWKSFYEFSVDTYCRLAHIELALGNCDNAKEAIHTILRNATSQKDKAPAHLALVRLTGDTSNSDYIQAVKVGLDLLNGDYGQVAIPLHPSKMDIAKERARLKVAKKGRPLARLTERPAMRDDSIMRLFEEVQKQAFLCPNTEALNEYLVLRCLRVAYSDGICYEVAIVALNYAVFQMKKENMKMAFKFGNLATLIKERFPESHKGSDAAKFDFRELMLSAIRMPLGNNITRCHDLYRTALSHGLTEMAFASAMSGTYCHFGAGYPLNSLFGSKLMLYERTSGQMKQNGFNLIFKASRQFLLNMMGKAQGDPLVFKGVALDEETALKNLEGNALKMGLRDISAFRIALAVILDDEKTMIEMLERLKSYPLQDLSITRNLFRQSYAGMACLIVGTNTEHAEYLRLAKSIVKMFKAMNKAGMVSTVPLSVCLKALEKPSIDMYNEAIESCALAGLKQFEALMCERCGTMILEQGNEKGSFDYFSRAFFLYNDIGMIAKTNQLVTKHKFLADVSLKRPGTASVCSSSRAGWDTTASSFGV
mmetsp:Transcript_26584/g.76786  ORF Transcript_26584/g.76786 Transcript_26584/m.76786 type:complete len:1162 (+) Transcript_26584:287-3772(+)